MIGKLKERGITLVALVVTIIIILILAGVTISQITGDNGLINRTTQAKEEYEKESLKEEIRLALLDKRLEKNGELSEDEIIKLLDEYGDIITDEEGKVTLKPDGTSYEIEYEEIINEETAGGSISGSGSESSQEKVEVSKEELENMKATLDKLEEEINVLKSAKEQTSLTIDKLSEKIPAIHKIYVKTSYTGSTEMQDLDLNYTMPANSFCSLGFYAEWR